MADNNQPPTASENILILCEARPGLRYDNVVGRSLSTPPTQPIRQGSPYEYMPTGPTPSEFRSHSPTPTDSRPTTPSVLCRTPSNLEMVIFGWGHMYFVKSVPTLALGPMGPNQYYLVSIHPRTGRYHLMGTVDLTLPF